MSAYDLEEQEQIATLKAWWKQYGRWVIVILSLAGLALFAWQGWSWYLRQQNTQASTLYNLVRKAAFEGDTQKVKAAAGELIENFSATSYAKLAAFNAAKVLADGGDVQSAQAQLSWIIKNADAQLRDIARLRLAALLLDQKNYDEAFQVVAAPVSASFELRFAETRGDILSAQNKTREARSAYQQAITLLDTAASATEQQSTLQHAAVSAPYREVLQQKLDALGEAD